MHIFSTKIFKYRNHQRIIQLILMFLVMNISAFGQEISKEGIYQQKVLISFGESLSNSAIAVSDEYDWKIIDRATDKVMNTGRGMSLKAFVFETPGNYLIELNLNENHNPTACSHGSGRVDIYLTVSNLKMVYDFSKVKFSSPIRKGVNTQNIMMTVPVAVNTFDKSDFRCMLQDVTTAGIGTHIIAKPVKKEILLSQGTQELTYRLSGIAEREAFIMFDFFDCNNQIQSFSLLEPIK